MSSAWVTLGLVAVLAAMHALLQKELPAYTLLLSLGAIVLLLVRLGGTFRSVLEGVALLGQAGVPMPAAQHGHPVACRLYPYPLQGERG